MIYTSVKVVQVPCPGRVNLRVPVSDTSLHHPIIYTPLPRWYRSRAQAGLTCVCLFQIPRYIITLHELLAHTPHDHVERESLEYAKSKLEELSRVSAAQSLPGRLCVYPSPCPPVLIIIIMGT